MKNASQGKGKTGAVYWHFARLHLQDAMDVVQGMPPQKDGIGRTYAVVDSAFSGRGALPEVKGFVRMKDKEREVLFTAIKGLPAKTARILLRLEVVYFEPQKKEP